MEIAQRAGLRFCGVEEAPPIDRDVRSCFLEAVASDRDIEFATIETTVDGDLLATIYGFEPDNGFVKITDWTQHRVGPAAWTITWCNRKVDDPETLFRLEGCKDGPEYR